MDEINHISGTPEGASCSTIVTASLDNYRPTIDLTGVSVRDALKLVELLQSVSSLINAAIDGEAPQAITHYLDDWQALLNETVFRFADIAAEMKPTDEYEQRARNWLLLRVRLACAEGLMDLTGPGAEEYDDKFSRQLMGRVSA